MLKLGFGKKTPARGSGEPLDPYEGCRRYKQGWGVGDWNLLSVVMFSIK